MTKKPQAAKHSGFNNNPCNHSKTPARVKRKQERIAQTAARKRGKVAREDSRLWHTFFENGPDALLVGLCLMGVSVAVAGVKGMFFSNI